MSDIILGLVIIATNAALGVGGVDWWTVLGVSSGAALIGLGIGKSQR